MTTPPLDPKGSEGAKKPQLQLVPPALMVETAKALQHGGGKYGPWNWRRTKVEMMTYLGAMKRHIDLLLEGEDIDSDSGAHHLGCVAASCAIVLDARKHGTLMDNRPGVKDVEPAKMGHADGCCCVLCEASRRTMVECWKCGNIYKFNPKSNICPRCWVAT